MKGSSVAAAVLVAVVVIFILGLFITLWLRDKGRADEVSEDRSRTQPEPVHTRPRSAREGAADEPPDISRERRQ